MLVEPDQVMSAEDWDRSGAVRTPSSRVAVRGQARAENVALTLSSDDSMRKVNRCQQQKARGRRSLRGRSFGASVFLMLIHEPLLLPTSS